MVNTNDAGHPFRSSSMTVDPAVLDRAAGALLGMAAGDALGAPYEFGPPLSDSTPLAMTGGGSLGWAPGEWTDDTSMAVPIAQALAKGKSLDDDATLDEIVGVWQVWARTAPDVGIQTRSVLGSLVAPTAAAAWDASRRHHDRQRRSGGNGSLMRTAPVALGYLDDGREDALAGAARRVSQLTHWEADAGDACVIWCLGIRHGVRTGDLDLRAQLEWLPPERRDRWRRLLDEAESKHPRDFANNGWVVEALQGAWSAIRHASGLVDATERAVRGGRDADTVAAIAGGLAGLVHGARALPDEWLRVLHGWPGLDADGLADLATRAVHMTNEGLGR